MFPQLGAPIGFLLSGGAFYLLTSMLSEEQFLRFGWRLPFLASSVLVLVGLYVRLTIVETPVFRAAVERQERSRVPMRDVFRDHGRILVLAILSSLSLFVLFYLLTVFTLSWGTTALGYDRPTFLLIQLIGMVFFALGIPTGAWLAERIGRRRTLIAVTVGIAAFGFALGPWLSSGLGGAALTMMVGLMLMGSVYGPIGTALSELFPTRVRYTGSSLAFSLAGIFGASLAPYVATWLATTYGLHYVGYYLAGASVLTLIGLAGIHETRDQTL